MRTTNTKIKANTKTKKESTSPIKNDTWQITTNRFVCFLDILGFKDLVLKEDHKTIYDKLDKISNFKKDLETFDPTTDYDQKAHKDFGDRKTHIVNFSDSIIIFSQGDTIQDFNLFTFTVGLINSTILSNGFLLKGAIAHGKISVNKDKQIYFGQPLINAFLLEEELNIISIACDHSIDKYFKNKRTDLEKLSMFIPYKQLKIHLKASGMITHYCLDSRRFIIALNKDLINDKQNNEEISQFINSFFNDFYTSVSGNPRRYIDNTLKHLKDLEDLEKI